MNRLFPYLLLFIVSIFIFYPLFKGELPIPSDSLVGLYHPFRDLYAPTNPNGIAFKNFLLTDPIRQQYPFRELAITTYKNFEIPTWNPYTFAGTPLLGNLQSAVFYPLNIFFFLLPFSYAWSLLVFSQPILMGIFLYAYLRSKHITQIASLFASVSYSFSGFSVAWMEWNTIVHAALWLPVILLSIERIVSIIQKKSSLVKNYILWGGIFIFASSASLFAGHIQTFFYVGILCVLYLGALLVRSVRKLQIISFFIVLVFCTLLVTSIQWIPSMQFILLSARDVDLVWTQPGWFIPVEHLVQFFAPDFFGNPSTLNYFGTWNYAELVGYIGIIPLTFALYALCTVRRKIVYFFTGILILSLIFSVENPFARLPFNLSIPFVSTSQPTRLLFLADFSLVILAAIGLNMFQKTRKKFYIPLGFVGVVFVFLWLTVFFNPFEMMSEHLSVAKRNLYLSSLLFVIMVITYVFVRFVKDKNMMFAGLSVLLLATSFDSFRFAQKFLPFTPVTYLYPHTQSLDFLMNQKGLFRVMSLDSRILPPNTSIMYNLQTIEGYDPLYLRRYGELIAAIERNTPDVSPPFGFNRIITPHRYDAEFASLLGVGYVLSLDELSDPSLTKVFEEGQTKIYKNERVFQRVFSVETIVPASSQKESIEKLFQFRDSLNNIAVVEHFENRSRKFSPAQVNITSYTSNKVIMDVSSEGESFIVFMDTYYPTWTATLETGRKLPMYITNYSFRGIVVPAGNHRVEFTNRLF